MHDPRPRIETLQETRLVGKKVIMSFAGNKTGELWQSFMPERGQIPNPAGPELYSVEVFDDPSFFETFDPTREFVKWAALRVHDQDEVPDGMEALALPAGQYAVFHYKGRPSEAQGTYQYIYDTWVPNSAYELDNRPHFALMGEKYKGEDPDSEEELWIPVRERA